VCSNKISCQLSLFARCLLWTNGLLDQDATWYGGRHLPRTHCVRWGPSSPHKNGTVPDFRPMSIVAKRLDGPICHLVRYTGRPRPRPYCVRWGPTPQMGTGPLQFAAHVCCGQTDGWIKMPSGMEVDLGPGHIVLDGDPAYPPKGHSSHPLFGPCLLWPNGRPSQLYC